MKRIISSALLIVMVLGLCLGAMTGCKGKTERIVDFVMPEGGFDTSKPVTIKFYHTMGAALQDILKDTIAEFNEKYPNIKYVVPYKDPVYAIVTMDEDGIDIKGTQSQFVGITPDEMGLYTKPNSWWKEVYDPGVVSTASQEDRYLPFE